MVTQLKFNITMKQHQEVLSKYGSCFIYLQCNLIVNKLKGTVCFPYVSICMIIAASLAVFTLKTSKTCVLESSCVPIVVYYGMKN